MTKLNQTRSYNANYGIDRWISDGLVTALYLLSDKLVWGSIAVKTYFYRRVLRLLVHFQGTSPQDSNEIVCWKSSAA